VTRRQVICHLPYTTHYLVVTMANASVLVRAARKSQRLAQVQLADRARIDQASVSRSEQGRDSGFDTIDRLLADAGHRLSSVPTRRDNAATVAAKIRERLCAGDQDRALRILVQLNDNLGVERWLVRSVLGLVEPESTTDPVWDAAVAALAAWRLGEENVPPPEWVNAQKSFSAQSAKFRNRSSASTPSRLGSAARVCQAWRSCPE